MTMPNLIVVDKYRNAFSTITTHLHLFDNLLCFSYIQLLHLTGCHHHALMNFHLKQILLIIDTNIITFGSFISFFFAYHCYQAFISTSRMSINISLLVNIFKKVEMSLTAGSGPVLRLYPGPNRNFFFYPTPEPTREILPGPTLGSGSVSGARPGCSTLARVADKA